MIIAFIEIRQTISLFVRFVDDDYPEPLLLLLQFAFEEGSVDWAV
jgi:hypothetical protein